MSERPYNPLLLENALDPRTTGRTRKIAVAIWNDRSPKP
jgi:hypothetical protein